jgi:H+/gluconate symporter-like permease
VALDPLVILGIGIATVLGLILVLRVNAFLALITAAMVVSLLSPGETATKISRVAEAFGTSAGRIAVVIALAAIIGECMMLSGAADRIVQAFLNLLGEKRTPWALMSSGYVLAIPVFFDTVFYLLVPLARSLYRRTGRNYLLSILAIAAGGAVTHTLVPPTPGPLLMAANLSIDLGLMILVGAVVALPAAVAGLFFSRLLDARLNIPYRELHGGTGEATPPAALPPLWLSLIPVFLPVVMISANTALSTLADNEGTALLRAEDVRDWDAFQAQLRAASPEQPSPAGRLRKLLSPQVDAWIAGAQPGGPAERQAVLQELNALLASNDVSRILAAQGRPDPDEKNRWLYEETAWEAVIQPSWKLNVALQAAAPDSEASERIRRQMTLNGLLARNREGFKRHERERFNRLALEAAFPGVIALHTYETPLRRWAGLSALLGDANFSLFLSAVVAMFLLWRQKRPTLGEMERMVEQALMSAGVIILITAGGGAFGEMLKTANIGPRIEALFESDAGSAAGLSYLLLGFGIASVLKVAQGSSTVAMITASGMMAAMISSPEQLGCNPVYLATAIGGGSLLGSWMNDSGFWIFAKMGGLTETEGLKTWTVMLVVLSAVSLGMSLLLATLLPLTSIG